VVYTTSGAVPTPASTVYRSPISLPRGGTVNAACVAPNGAVGMMASKRFPGFAPTGWKVVAVDNRTPTQADNAANAIDGNTSTLWQTGDSPLPHSLTVDMGRSLRIGGLGYVPRQDRNRNGVVDAFRFETGADGKNWTTNIDQGRFGNIRNNPVAQEVRFAPVAARFFRFTALREINGKNSTSAAEITVLPAESEDGKPN
jgi:alpha-L-fucosidase